MNQIDNKRSLFEILMGFVWKFICIVLVDFITLQTVLKGYEMRMSVKVCCAAVIFLILFMAVLWMNKEDKTERLRLKINATIVLFFLVVFCFVGIFYIQHVGNSKIESTAAYIGYKLPMIVGITDSKDRLLALEESIHLSPEEYSSFKDYAYELLANERYDEAEIIANKMIKLDSNNSDGYAIRGVCYFYGHIGEDNEELYDAYASNDLKKALDLGNDEISTLYCYGWLCYNSEKYEYAENTFDKAIHSIIHLKFNTHSTPSLCSNCYYYYAMSRYNNKGQQYDEAQERALNDAISILPTSYSYIQLGNLYCNKNENQKAEEAYDKAVELSPNVYSHLSRGDYYYYHSNHHDEAKKDYQYIIDYYSDYGLPDDETIVNVRNAMAKL